MNDISGLNEFLNGVGTAITKTSDGPTSELARKDLSSITLLPDLLIQFL